MVTTTKRALQLTAALACLTLLSPARAAEGCPSSQWIEVDIERWRAEVLAGAGLDEALSQMQMRALPPIGEGDTLTLEGVDHVWKDVSAAHVPELIVQVRLRSAAGWVVQRVQVLRPLGMDSWCALGDELSRDTSPAEAPCEAAWDEPLPRVFDFVHLVDDTRWTIVTHDAAGRCDGASAMRFATTYWDVEGAALVERSAPAPGPSDFADRAPGLW